VPVTVKVDWESDPLQFGSGGGGDGLHYNVHGATTKAEAWEAVRALAPTFLNGFVRNDISVTEVGPNFCKARVTYGTLGVGGSDVPVGEQAIGDPPPAEFGEPPATDATAVSNGYEFSWVSEMRHKTLSLGTRYRRLPGDALISVGSAPDFRRAVGVARSGSSTRVEGYDAPEPTSSWSRTVVVNPMTLAYYRAVRDLVGKKNNGPFYFSSMGECLLWGVSGRNVQGDEYSLTFTFHERPNITNLVLVPDDADPDPDDPDPDLPGALVIPAAYGWDYIWVQYEEELGADEILNRPKAAYVEQIIPFGDFSVLNIGE
jgi:hypothetical protein